MIFSGQPQTNRPSDSKTSQTGEPATCPPVVAKTATASVSVQPRASSAAVTKPTLVYFGKSPATNQPAVATPSRPPGSWW